MKKHIEILLLSFIGALLIIFLSSATIKIMPVGDSLTESFHPGYRGYLYKMLRDSGFVVDFVGVRSHTPEDPRNQDPHHAGFGGYIIGPDSSKMDVSKNTKTNIYWQLDNGTKIMSVSTDIMILMIGTNDYSNELSPSYDPRTNGALRLDSLVEKIYRLSPDLILLLSNITPRKTDLTAGFASKFNSEVPGIVAKQIAKGRKCYFVNNNNNSFLSTDFEDGTHFNAEGYQKLAKNFYDALKPVLMELKYASINTPNENSIRIYPNPVSNSLTLSNVFGELSIFNLFGQEIRNIKNYYGETISVSGMNSGIYLLKTESKTLSFIKL